MTLHTFQERWVLMADLPLLQHWQRLFTVEQVEGICFEELHAYCVTALPQEVEQLFQELERLGFQATDPLCIEWQHYAQEQIKRFGGIRTAQGCAQCFHQILLEIQLRKSVTRPPMEALFVETVLDGLRALYEKHYHALETHYGLLGQWSQVIPKLGLLVIKLMNSCQLPREHLYDWHQKINYLVNAKNVQELRAAWLSLCAFLAMHHPAQHLMMEEAQHTAEQAIAQCWDAHGVDHVHSLQEVLAQRIEDLGRQGEQRLRAMQDAAQDLDNEWLGQELANPHSFSVHTFEMALKSRLDNPVVEQSLQHWVYLAAQHQWLPRAVMNRDHKILITHLKDKNLVTGLWLQQLQKAQTPWEVQDLLLRWCTWMRLAEMPLWYQTFFERFKPVQKPWLELQTLQSRWTASFQLPQSALDMTALPMKVAQCVEQHFAQDWFWHEPQSLALAQDLLQELFLMPSTQWELSMGVIEKYAQRLAQNNVKLPVCQGFLAWILRLLGLLHWIQKLMDYWVGTQNLGQALQELVKMHASMGSQSTGYAGWLNEIDEAFAMYHWGEMLCQQGVAPLARQMALELKAAQGVSQQKALLALWCSKALEYGFEAADIIQKLERLKQSLTQQPNRAPRPGFL